MRPTSRRLALALAIMWVASTACGGGSGDGTPARHAISGTVTGAAGVKVTLGGDAAASTTTDPGGHYAFPGLADGDYTVTPSLAGHLFSPQHLPAHVAGGDVALGAFSGAALVPYDDFSSLGLAAARWDGGQRHARLEGQAAVLSSSIAGPEADTAYVTALSVQPGARVGPVTSASATVQLDSATVAGDSSARAGLDLVFQPPQYRVAAPENLTNALFLRAALVESAGGLVAVRQAFECTNSTCSTTQGVGTVLAGATWPLAGVSAAQGTPYTVSISLDTATSIVTFTLSGGATGTARIDLTTSATPPPFPLDLSPDNFLRTRLFSMVRGGAAGGGSGAVQARFDDVYVGVDGDTATLLDDFATGTSFDTSRWSVGEERALVLAGPPPALQLALEQAGSPAVAAVALAADVTALQATVSVSEWSRAGTGQVGARLAVALYNDGGPGLSPPPTPADVPGTSSQVGDVVAQISMTETDVSCAVTRCSVAVCSAATGNQLSFVQPRTSLGTITKGTAHVLRISWDAASHTVSFQLDGEPPVSFDPVAAGHANAGPPGKPFWQLATHTTAAGPGEDFTTGSSGRIVALFRDVKRL